MAGGIGFTYPLGPPVSVASAVLISFSVLFGSVATVASVAFSASIASVGGCKWKYAQALKNKKKLFF